MPATETYDAIIIGSGQAAGPLATALASAGRKTVLIEREHIGGTCINEGCTPTKTMVASADVANVARRAAGYGVDITGSISVNMQEVRRRKRDIVEEFRSGSRKQIEAGGVTVLMGEGRFSGPHEVSVETADGTHSLTAPLIVIDTGGRPSTPKIPGLDTVESLNSTTIMELATVPEHLIALGGGYIGVEFAQMFRRFGSDVTIVESAPRLLMNEDEDVSDTVARILRDDGITILLDTAAREVNSAGGGVSVTVERDGEQQNVTGSHILVATGRVPNTEALNLPAAGVRTNERGFVNVDERLRTNVEGIYAAGDVTGAPPFTHISFDDYRILKANLIDGGDRTTTGRLVPYTVFIDPQLGRVGVTESAARKQGTKIKVASMPMTSVARAIEVDRTQGFMKVVVDEESGSILGCAILGMEGGELMAMLEIAMMGNVRYTDLLNGIFAHPTLAEAFNNLFQSWK